MTLGLLEVDVLRVFFFKSNNERHFVIGNVPTASHSGHSNAIDVVSK